MANLSVTERLRSPAMAYLLIRLIALVVCAVFSTWAKVSYSYIIDVPLAIAATVAFVFITIAAFVVVRRPGVDLRRVLPWFIGPDMLVVGLFGVAFGSFQDPSYPMLFAMAVLYALFMRRRDSWVVGLAATIVYLSVQVVSPLTTDAMEYSIVLLKAAQLLAVTSILGVTSANLAYHEREALLRTQEEEHLNAQLKLRLSELQAVSQISDIIHSSLDFERIGPLLIEILSKVLGLSACCLYVIDKSKSETVFSARTGSIAAPVRFKPYEVGNIEALDLSEAHLACIPVAEHEQMMVVFCADSGDLERMSAEDKIVLQAISSELVVAVENWQLYKLTRRMAITDELTDLHNYRYLQQRLDEEIERARRYGKDLSLLMIDVDDFKRFNDANGHVAGDKALRELGVVMRSTVREVDIVCRYGGEEFSIVLPETDAAGAFVVAEKLREAVSRHAFANADDELNQHITVSIGLASYPIHALDKEMLLKKADDALYQAKHGGKDRVWSPMSVPVTPVAPSAPAVMREREIE